MIAPSEISLLFSIYHCNRKSHLQVQRVCVQLYITVVYVAVRAAFGASK